MAVVIRTQLGPDKKGKGRVVPMVKKPADEALGLSLPEEVSKVSHNINEYHILIHGEKKIGKTTFTLVEPNVFLLTFDPLQKAYPVMQRHVPNWNHFMEYLSMLEARAKSGKFPYSRVVIDGADICYRDCQKWACTKLAIGHPSDEAWGKGWDLLKESFSNAIDRLLALPCGVWFISHSTWREVETRRTGVKLEKLVPLLKSGGEEILVGKVDGWFAYDYVEQDRVLIIRGDERTGAGNRIKGHFLTPKGRKVKEIPMGDSEEEAYKNFLDAFGNKQRFVTLDERDEAVSAKPAVPQAKKGAPVRVPF